MELCYGIATNIEWIDDFNRGFRKSSAIGTIAL
jgi:hypothetical protein